MDKRTEERIARNDATFRDANERIRNAAEEHGVAAAVPFVCECADESCREIVQMSVEDYGEVRSNPRWFLNAPGHDAAARGSVEVVASRGGYVVVEKVGHAGEVAEDLAASDERDAAA